MKHIKLFENFQFLLKENINKLDNLTNNYLSYLKDDGFNIEVENIKYLGIESYMIHIEILKDDNIISSFKWNNIKDDIIQFIEMIKKEYKIIEIKFGLSDKNGNWLTPVIYSVNDILDNKVDTVNNINIISINVK